jgi:hypothetical protein
VKHRAGMVPGETVQVRGSGRLVTPSPVLPPKKVEPKRPRARVLRSLLTTVRNPGSAGPASWTRQAGVGLGPRVSPTWPARPGRAAPRDPPCRHRISAAALRFPRARTAVPSGRGVEHPRPRRHPGGPADRRAVRSPGVVRVCSPGSQGGWRVPANTRSDVSCGGSAVPVAAGRCDTSASGPDTGAARPPGLDRRPRPGHVSRGTSALGKPAPVPPGHGQAAGHSLPPAHRWISHPGNRRTHGPGPHRCFTWNTFKHGALGDPSSRWEPETA